MKSTALMDAGAEQEAEKGGVYMLAAVEIYQLVQQICEGDSDAFMTVALSSKCNSPLFLLRIHRSSF